MAFVICRCAAGFWIGILTVTFVKHVFGDLAYWASLLLVVVIGTPTFAGTMFLGWLDHAREDAAGEKLRRESEG